MTSPYLGIDISKEHFDVALFRDNRYLHGRFENTPCGFRKLLNWLKKQNAQKCPSCMEATGRYGEELAEKLYERGHPVSVVNPANIKQYAKSRMRRNKTDREDAKLIAHYCATQSPYRWKPLSPHMRELQEMSRRRESLMQSRTQEKNRLGSGLRSTVVINDIKATIAYFDRQIEALDQAMRDHVDHHPDIKEKLDLLTSIPSIGFGSATAFLAEVPDISRFRSASQLAAYAGLTPSLNHSGKQTHSSGTLSKLGKRRLRTIFFMSQMSARRYNPVIQNLRDRLALKGKPPKTIRGAIMRKLLHLAYGVLKTGLPFDAQHHTNDLQAAC